MCIRGCYLGQNVPNYTRMPFTYCPQCAGQISEEDANCPHCGHSLWQTTGNPPENWRERFRQIHSDKGLVEAVRYLRKTGVNPSEIRSLLEEEKAAGRIPRLPDASS